MRYVVQASAKKSHISRHIYGNFSEHLGRCIYDGVFVGKDSPIPNVNGMRTDVVEALKKLNLPNLRWPGGCFADEYHWKDGIGPLEKRKRIVNNNWGGVVEDNSFGTHEFFELCRQLGCEPYITGNVGSGTVQEMQEWIEYMNSSDVSPMADLRRANGQEEPWNVKYFGVGNESWGCGGNMTADYYADVYRRYQVYLRRYNGNKLYKIACGTGTSVGDTGFNWTKTLMEKAAKQMDGISLHYYTVPFNNWKHKGSASEFSDEEYACTMTYAYYIEKIISDNAAVMDLYDPEKRIGLIVDEWGTWFDAEPGTNPKFLYQQNTIRDALVAAISLNIFNKHSDRVHMANIAQLINVLQAVMLTDGEKMILTPTYHVFDMYKDHQEATLLESAIDCPTMEAGGVTAPVISESASIAEDDSVLVTIANLSDKESAPIEMRVDSVIAKSAKARLLSGARNAKNDFDDPENVMPEDVEVSFTTDAHGTELALTLPPCGIMTIKFEQ